MDGVGRRFFSGMKKAVAVGSHCSIDRRKVMDDENPIKTGMNKGRSGTVGSRRLFGSFWAVQKEPAVGTVDQKINPHSKIVANP